MKIYNSNSIEFWYYKVDFQVLIMNILIFVHSVATINIKNWWIGLYCDICATSLFICADFCDLLQWDFLCQNCLFISNAKCFIRKTHYLNGMIWTQLFFRKWKLLLMQNLKWRPCTIRDSLTVYKFRYEDKSLKIETSFVTIMKIIDSISNSMKIHGL